MKFDKNYNLPPDEERKQKLKSQEKSRIRTANLKNAKDRIEKLTQKIENYKK